MVAYSFQKRFIAPIRQGLIDPMPQTAKCQTIRSARKRHARPGEPIQLYYGMRTKYCEKIIPDPICTAVYHDLEMMIERHRFQMIRRRGDEIERADYDTFARQDGFENIAAMHEFWAKEHGLGLFKGVLIMWKPQQVQNVAVPVAA